MEIPKDIFNKFENLVEDQRMKKETIETIFANLFNKVFGIEEKVKLEITFGKDNLVFVKIKDKSSIKQVAREQDARIREEYLKIYPKDNLKII